MNALSEPARKIQYARQTQSAMDLDRNQSIRNADLQSSAFISHVVLPALKAAESRLSESGIQAITTDRINTQAARCMLTVTVDEDAAPAVLAFEARLGSTAPRVRWTRGGTAHLMADFDQAAVETILNDFLDTALRHEEQPA